jgi:hypothetical protein
VGRDLDQNIHPQRSLQGKQHLEVELRQASKDRKLDQAPIQPILAHQQDLESLARATV